MTFPVSLGGAVLADFNGDGNLDAAFTGNLIAFGNGDGTFQKPVTLAPGLKAPNVFGNFATADLNGDGAPDIVSADAFNANLFVLLNNGKGTFTMNIFTENAVIPTQVVLADVNGDGKQDPGAERDGPGDCDLFRERRTRKALGCSWATATARSKRRRSSSGSGRLPGWW